MPEPTRAEIARVTRWQKQQAAVKAADAEARRIERERAVRDRLSALLVGRKIEAIGATFDTWTELRAVRLALDDGRTVEFESGYDNDLDVQEVKPNADRP